MKKIIATVLAMVMALALCTTAFAATVEYTAVDQNGTAIDGKYTVEAKDGKYKVSSLSNTVDHYVVTKVGDGWTGYYVAADKSDYTVKLSADGKADLYLTLMGEEPASVTYKAKAVVYTNIGDNCGQLAGTKSNTYYKATWEDANEETVVKYYVKSTTGTLETLLVDGELVKASLVGASGELNPHNWKAASYDAKDNVTTYKCKDCGTVATVYKTMDAAKASGAAVYTQYNGQWIAYTDGTTTTPSKENTTSPKTFDAGIAMYVGMALTSVAGSAVVIGKKKEF